MADNSLLKEKIALLAQEVQLMKERNELEGVTYTKAAQTQQLLKAEIEFLTEVRTLKQDEKALKDELEKLQQKELDTATQLTEREKERLNTLRIVAQTSKKEIDEQLKAALQSQKRIEGAAAKLAGNFLTSLTGIRTFSNTVSGDLIKDIMKVEGRLHPMIEMIGGIGTSAIDAVVQNTRKMVGQFDQARVELNKVTGQFGKYDAVLEDFATGTESMAVGLSGATSAIAALNQNMSTFSGLSAEASKGLIKQVGELEKLGVSADVAAEGLDFMTKSLGMSNEAAMQQQRDIIAAGEAIGISAAKMTKNFAASADMIAKWGESGVEIFKDLAATAKATGVEMATLIGIAEGFNTFEDATASAAKLNQLLGGQFLDSMAMLNATEEQRIALLREGVEASGKSWESMTQFEKQALKNAAGFSSMAEASKFFTTSPQDIEKYKDSMDGATMSAEEQEKRALENMTAQEKMAHFMEKLAVAILPITELLNKMTEWLIEVNQAMDGNLGIVLSLTAAVGGLALVWLKVKSVMAAISTSKQLAQLPGLMQNLGKSTQKAAADIADGGKKMAAGGTQVGAAQQTMGNSGKTSMAGMLQGALGLLAIAAAIAVFAFSIWLLSDIGIGTIAAIGGILIGFALAMAFVGIIAAKVGVPIALGFGLLSAAMILIAAAFLLFNVGFEPFVSQIERLAGIGLDGLVNVGLGLGAIGLGLLGLSLGMIAFATANFYIMDSDWEMFFKIIETLGRALGGVRPESAQALATVFGTLTNLTDIENMADGIAMLSQALFGLAFAMMFLTKESVENFKISAEGFVEYVDAGSKITEPMVDNVKRFVDQSVRYRAAKNQATFGGLFAGGKDEFVDALKAGSAAGAAPAATGGGNKTIIMQVNGRELGRVVDDLINKKYSLSVKQ